MICFCATRFRISSLGWGLFFFRVPILISGIKTTSQRDFAKGRHALEGCRLPALFSQRDGRVAEDELFYAEQNARLVKNAEKYYRSMFLEEVSSWNLRDRHMVETLNALVAHLDRQGGRAKLVVCA